MNLSQFQMRKEPTTHIEEIGIVCSLKLASSAPFREYTHSVWSAARTKQLLSLASRRMFDDQVFSVKEKDSTCWTERRRDSSLYASTCQQIHLFKTLRDRFTDLFCDDELSHTVRFTAAVSVTGVTVVVGALSLLSVRELAFIYCLFFADFSQFLLNATVLY